MGRNDFSSGTRESVAKTGTVLRAVPQVSDCAGWNGSGEAMLAEEKLEYFF